MLFGEATSPAMAFALLCRSPSRYSFALYAIRRVHQPLHGLHIALLLSFTLLFRSVLHPVRASALSWPSFCSASQFYLAPPRSFSSHSLICTAHFLISFSNCFSRLLKSDGKYLSFCTCLLGRQAAAPNASAIVIPLLILHRMIEAARSRNRALCICQVYCQLVSSRPRSNLCCLTGLQFSMRLIAC